MSNGETNMSACNEVTFTVSHITLDGKNIDAAKFSNLDRAMSWAYSATKLWVVTKGSDIRVVRPVDAAKLEKIGYKIAR